MKSNFFREYSLSEDAKKNICVLADMSDQNLDILATWFLSQKIYTYINSSVIKELSEKTGEGAQTLRKATRAADFFLKRMGEYQDIPDDLIADLLSLKILPKTSPQLLGFLNKLFYWHIHSQVKDFKSSCLKHEGHNIFANVMDVSLNSSNYYSPQRSLAPLF